MGIRTPDLLHAMKPAPSSPPALTWRDQPKQRPRATQSDAEQRPPTPICYPDRYLGHARSALPWHQPRRALQPCNASVAGPEQARLCPCQESQHAERTPGATACRAAHPRRAGRSGTSDSGSPVCQEGLFPAWIVCPVLAVVKQSALDDVCGPAPAESAGSDQENGLVLLA